MTRYREKSYSGIDIFTVNQLPQSGIAGTICLLKNVIALTVDERLVEKRPLFPHGACNH
jgi:hypothetical protein